MEILKNFLWTLTFFAPRAISVLEQIIQLKGGLPTFHLDYRDPLPIYEQLKQECKRLILSGIIAPGDKLPSVRDLAQEAAVNPNTMQKALSELERSGLIYSQRTSGRFITEDKELIHQMKKELAAAEVSAFVAHMKQLGITPEEIRQLLAETIEEEENHE